MSDSFTNITNSRNTDTEISIPGKMADTIGSGHHAQASIVWLTIRACFYLCAAIIVFILIYGATNKDVSVSVDEIKGICEIFIPVITLSLGYIFGKS